MPDNEPTVETIAESGLWEAVAEPINEIAQDEGVFEFHPDGFRVGTNDAATVCQIDQRIDPGAFEHFNVEGDFMSGVRTVKLDDLLSAVADVPVEFGWDWDNWTWSFKADDVDYDMAGIDHQSVNGSPADRIPLKDEMTYNVDVTLPVDKFKRATEIVDMNADHATFHMGGPGEIFEIFGAGDDDVGRVHIHEDPDFEWNDDPPESVTEARQSNSYMQNVAGLLDEDTVRMVTGPEVPYHIWTERHDVIDTKIVQAPLRSES